VTLARILSEPLAAVDWRLQHSHLVRAALVRPAQPQRTDQSQAGRNDRSKIEGEQADPDRVRHPPSPPDGTDG
jgi:hypothetical protein